MIIGKMINKAEIATLIPHSGNMVLIDEVSSWNETEIFCHSNTHRNLDNPLRANQQLSALNLIEYGAQAVAIHGGLLDSSKAGFLAAIRNAQLSIQRIDQLNSELMIHATATIQTDSGVIYQLHLSDKRQQTLLTAQATIIHP